MAAALGRYVKQPNETLDYNVDYTDWFAGRGDAPASFTVVTDPGLTVVGSSLTGNVVKVTVSGGTPGSQYKVTVRLTTTAAVPVTKEADFYVRIREV